MFLIDNELFACNIGDSRILLISNNQPSQISKDHHPESEIDRIEQAGGFVEQTFDKNTKVFSGPMRVWNRARTGPGLAMSRSLGDNYAHMIGVSEMPDIFNFYLSTQDQIIVIGSDGIWEVLTNQDVTNILLPFLDHASPDPL